MNMKFLALLAACFLAVAPVFPASATLLFYDASLSALNENPPHPTSSGTGTALIEIDTTANTMVVMVVFANLTTNTIAAHIHCCTSPPNNTIVATQVPFFTGFPIGVTSGSYDHTFDLTDAASYNGAFITANGGTVASAEAALLAGLAAGEAYLNIHTTQFPGGEIRGFLQACTPETSQDSVTNPCVTVPEPASLALLGLGFAGFAFSRRHKLN